MIAAWMLYTIVVSLVVAAAAAALDVVARTTGIATRWVWAGAMIGALALSFAELASPSPALPPASIALDTMRKVPRRIASTPPVTVFRGAAPARDGFIATVERVAARMRASVDDALMPIRRLDISALDGWNRWLAALWLAAGAAGLLYLLAGLWRMRRMTRAFSVEIVDGRTVFISTDVGPALIGVRRLRIVLPSWVLELPPKDRRVILAHEEQHAAAADPLLLLACSVAVIAQPWNPALWLLLSRVRLAIETDCDRRVLTAAQGDVRHYGGLLVTVHQRVSPPLGPLAFAERPSNLERRIRRMTESAPRLVSFAGISAACAALVLLAAAWIAPSPAQRAPNMPAFAGDTTIKRERSLSLPNLVPDVCGLGPRSTTHCSVKADVLINVVDSIHVAVALRERDAAGIPIEHVFYLTSMDRLPARLSRYVASAYVEYEGGELYVSDPRSTAPPLLFVGGRTRTLSNRYTNAETFDRLVGISHYSADGLPFDAVPFLRQAATCFDPDEICYEAGGKKVMFP